MRTRDLERVVLAALWPAKPPDILIVLLFAFGASAIIYSENGDQPSWASWWAGVALGELVVIGLMARRARKHGP